MGEEARGKSATGQGDEKLFLMTDEQKLTAREVCVTLAESFAVEASSLQNLRDTRDSETARLLNYNLRAEIMRDMSAALARAFRP